MVFLIIALIIFVSSKRLLPTPNAANAACLKSRYRSSLSTAAFRFTVPRTRLEAMLFLESSDGTNTNHSLDEVGIFAIRPATEAVIKKAYPQMQNYSAANPYEAIQLAAAYLNMAYKIFRNWDRATIAYNAGLNSKLPLSEHYQDNEYLKLVKARENNLCP